MSSSIIHILTYTREQQRFFAIQPAEHAFTEAVDMKCRKEAEAGPKYGMCQPPVASDCQLSLQVLSAEC